MQGDLCSTLSSGTDATENPAFGKGSERVGFFKSRVGREKGVLLGLNNLLTSFCWKKQTFNTYLSDLSYNEPNYCQIVGTSSAGSRWNQINDSKFQIGTTWTFALWFFFYHIIWLLLFRKGGVIFEFLCFSVLHY